MYSHDLVTRSEVVEFLEGYLQNHQATSSMIRKDSDRHDITIEIRLLNELIEEIVKIPPIMGSEPSPPDSSLQAHGIPNMKLTFSFHCMEMGDALTEGHYQDPGREISHNMVLTITDAETHHFVRAVTQHQRDCPNHLLQSIGLVQRESA